MQRTEVPDWLCPLDKLAKMNIIEYSVFSRRLPDFNEKEIYHSGGESTHHIALKALAYYELLRACLKI